MKNEWRRFYPSRPVFASSRSGEARARTLGSKPRSPLTLLGLNTMPVGGDQYSRHQGSMDFVTPSQSHPLDLAISDLLFARKGGYRKPASIVSLPSVI